MNGLDLFSGYGGAQDALRRFVSPVAYCEIERGARRILLRRMRKGQIGAAPIWDDVRTLRRMHIGTRIDIITGGFPCQDVSAAGMRRGLDGERSGLFFEVVRLIREFRPAFVYLENVPGLLVRGMDRVSAELAQAGYDHRAGVLSAFDMGASHIRERVWILAADSDRILRWDERQEMERGKPKVGGRPTFAGYDREKSTLSDSENDGSRRGIEFSESSEGARNVAHAYSVGSVERRFPFVEKSQYSESYMRSKYGCRVERWAPEPELGRVAHGIANRSDRIRALGNGWVPQTAREAFFRLLTGGGFE